jgi:AraC-like DNA-binding protein
MLNWSTRFTTLGSFASLPRALCVTGEVQFDGRYHHWGRLRSADHYALFKYSLSGCGAFRDRTGVHAIPPGHGFLCEVNDPEIEYYYPDQATEPWTFVWATFDGSCAIQWTRDLVRQMGPVFQLPRESAIIEHICSFENQSEQHRVIQADWSAEFVLSLLLALTRSTKTGSNGAGSGGLVSRVQEMVANNLSQDINGKMIANRLRVSREHLSRTFRKETGTTLHGYILRQKMDYASYLLKHTDYTVKEIAGRIGYDSPAHFGRTFRRIKGQTPGAMNARG